MSCGERSRPNGRVATASSIQFAPRPSSSRFTRSSPSVSVQPTLSWLTRIRVLRERRGGVPGQRHQAALRHRVGPERVHADVGVDRADVDDRAAARAPSSRSSASCIRMNGARRLTAIIRSQNATLADSIEAREVEAGVVDQDVEAAEAVDRGRAPGRGRRPRRPGRRRRRRRRRHAARMPAAIRSPASTSSPCTTTRGAERGEVLGDAAADAGARSGDERDALATGKASRLLERRAPAPT